MVQAPGLMFLMKIKSIEPLSSLTIGDRWHLDTSSDELPLELRREPDKWALYIVTDGTTADRRVLAPRDPQLNVGTRLTRSIRSVFTVSEISNISESRSLLEICERLE